MREPKKTSVIIVCTSLNMPGGIERAVVNTANLFVTKGHAVCLLVLAPSASSFYPIDPAVRISSADLDFGITGTGNVVSKKLHLVSDIRFLRSIFIREDPQAIITTEYMLTIATVLAGFSKRVISWEHHHFNHLQRNAVWRWLYRKSYPQVNQVVCLNKSEAVYYKTMGCRTTVIPNFISMASTESLHYARKSLLTVGWLTHVKGIDLIPKIATLVKMRHPDWQWRVTGSGPLEKWLLEEITRKGLGTFLLVGAPQSPNLSEVYNEAAIYVMTSRFECFPMVLLEAMAQGIPAVAFDCPTGPHHIISNEIDGLLIESNNVEHIAGAINGLIADERKRIAMGEHAKNNIQRFNKEDVYRLWSEVMKLQMD